jgi:hypothetical protein
MTASPRRSRQIGADIHSSGGNNVVSNNSNNPNIPLASGSDSPPRPARLFNKSSPNGTVRRSRMSLGVIVSGVALVLMVVSCAVGPSVFGDLTGAQHQQVQMKLQQRMQDNQQAETQQQMQQLRSTMDANAAIAAAADAQPNDMTVSDLAAHVSSEVETHVEALKTQLAGYAASAAAEAVREELANVNPNADPVPAVAVADQTDELEDLKTSDEPESSEASGSVEQAVAHVNPAFTNGGQPPACTLNPDGPVPVALVTLGRSGSSSIWQVMGTLTGQETHSVEYTGSDLKTSKQFLDLWQDDDNGNWALKYMCKKQEEFSTAGIVGFKWKPFKDTFLHSKSLAALRMIAGTHNPQIKVVRSKRNGLDRAISIYKHRQSGGAPAHCKVGHQRCIEAHQKAASGLIMPIDNMMERLEKEFEEELMVDRVLQELGVPHVYVSFDELFYGQNVATEWARIFEFLGVGPTDDLTVPMVEQAMMHAATSNPFHNQTIANFDEVSAALMGTKFEKWLH